MRLVNTPVLLGLASHGLGLAIDSKFQQLNAVFQERDLSSCNPSNMPLGVVSPYHITIYELCGLKRRSQYGTVRKRAL